MTQSRHRPEGYSGKLDVHLPDITERLTQVLAQTQRSFAFDTLRLGQKDLSKLAETMADFAEDLHAGIGFWQAYERYNTDFFGTALPMTERENPSRPLEGIHLDRVRHLLWKLYPQLEGRPDPRPSP